LSGPQKPNERYAVPGLFDHYGLAYICRHPEIFFGGTGNAGYVLPAAPPEGDSPASVTTCANPDAATDSGLTYRVMKAYHVLNDIYAPTFGPRNSVRNPSLYRRRPVNAYARRPTYVRGSSPSYR
jgi:hypothetical protein